MHWGSRRSIFYCRRLRESAALLSDIGITANPIDRAESYRYLLTMTAYTVDAGSR